ncbi:MAG: S49 family peptidase [Pseudomonadales bacterium]|nr:S49 family peptidase [Pseudomonadales bacterium]
MSDNQWREDSPVASNAGNSGSASKDSKEWKLIEKTMGSMLSEQRRSRRWGIFFKLLGFGYLISIVLMFSSRSEVFDEASSSKGAHTAYVDIQGVIAANQDANADSIAGALRKAFSNEDSVAVMLRINSPGGSPVQSGYVYDEIKRLREKYPDKKLYSVIGDLGASGAYYIAAASDEIWADKASLVGSIGVTAAGFGFTEVIKKLGIERRKFTSGDHKAFLDPFSPVVEEEKVFWEGVLKTTHQQFIGKVKEGRGDRLKLTEGHKLFSGLIWTGQQSLELGLIDGLGSPGYVAREVIGEEKLVDYTLRPSPFKRFTDRLGTSIGNTLARNLGLEEYRSMR